MMLFQVSVDDDVPARAEDKTMMPMQMQMQDADRGSGGGASAAQEEEDGGDGEVKKSMRPTTARRRPPKVKEASREVETKDIAPAAEKKKAEGILLDGQNDDVSAAWPCLL